MNDVVSPFDSPNKRKSTVDGYAVLSLTPGKYKVTGTSLAGRSSTSVLSNGVCRITTGATVPTNAIGVVMVEDTVLVSTTPNGEEDIVEILNTVNYKNVREVGSDLKKGELLISKGDKVSIGGVGVLVSAGIKQVY